MADDRKNAWNYKLWNININKLCQCHTYKVLEDILKAQLLKQPSVATTETCLFETCVIKR